MSLGFKTGPDNSFMQLHFCTFLYECNDLCFIYFWTKLLTNLYFGISIQIFPMDKGLRESLILTRILILEAFVHWIFEYWFIDIPMRVVSRKEEKEEKRTTSFSLLSQLRPARTRHVTS